MDGFSRLLDRARMPGLVVIDVADELVMSTAGALIRRGFPVGPSSELNDAAAVEAARRLGPNAQVVTVFPDRMERYFSAEIIRRPGSPAPTSAGSGLPMAVSPPPKG